MFVYINEIFAMKWSHNKVIKLMVLKCFHMAVFPNVNNSLVVNFKCKRTVVGSQA